MSRVYRILAVNPGSTSTKIALFENEKKVFMKNIIHDPADLAQFEGFHDQLPFRTQKVSEALADGGINLETIDAYIGRGGGIVPSIGGIYEVNDILLHDAIRAATGAHHCAELGSQICDQFARRFHKKAYISDSPDTDEFQDLARVTGLKNVYRKSHVHALNQKEVARRYCAENGKKYTECNLVVCHIGGGISVGAHRNGRIIDANDLIGGDGPMMPSRSGAIPAVELVKFMDREKLSAKEMITRINKQSGLLEHLGTDSALEIEKRIQAQDPYAELVYNAMIYQIAKQIGATAAVLKGKAEAIILTGGISNSTYVTDKIREYAGWIAPVVVMAGEFEMESMAASVLRVLRNEQKALEYTGIPVWNGFFT